MGHLIISTHLQGLHAQVRGSCHVQGLGVAPPYEVQHQVLGRERAGHEARSRHDHALEELDAVVYGALVAELLQLPGVAVNLGALDDDVSAFQPAHQPGSDYMADQSLPASP